MWIRRCNKAGLPERLSIIDRRIKATPLPNSNRFKFRSRSVRKCPFHLAYKVFDSLWSRLQLLLVSDSTSQQYRPAWLPRTSLVRATAAPQRAGGPSGATGLGHVWQDSWPWTEAASTNGLRTACSMISLAQQQEMAKSPLKSHSSD